MSKAGRLQRGRSGPGHGSPASWPLEFPLKPVSVTLTASDHEPSALPGSTVEAWPDAMARGRSL